MTPELFDVYVFDVEDELAILQDEIAQCLAEDATEPTPAMRVRFLLERYRRCRQLESLRCAACGEGLAGMNPDLFALARIRWRQDLCVSCIRVLR